MRNFLKKSVVVAALLSAQLLPINVQAQQAAGIEQIEHVVLNEDLAKQAIDATLYVRKNYSDRRLSEADPATMIKAMKDGGVYSKMAVELRKFGFDSPESWSKAAMSTAVAVGFMKNSNGTDMLSQMRQMQESSGMSAEMKAEMMGVIEAMMPPKANMKIAKLLLKDRSYAAKVSKLFDN